MNTATAITVGFVGLGSQGGPMARRIAAAGYPLVLWARRRDTLAAYADTAAQTADTLAELGVRCDHIGICVVDDAGVSAVVDGLLPSMHAGSRIAIHSTIHPETCVALAQRAAERGVMLIDAPVSGGGHGAAAGTLTVMVGGNPAAVQLARPVFETFAGLIQVLGGVGAGQIAKLINNALMAATMSLADAAIETGHALGLDGAQLAELIKVSSGRSYAFEVRARLTDIGRFDHGAQLLSKDVRLLDDVSAGAASAARLCAVAGPFLKKIVEKARENHR